MQWPFVKRETGLARNDSAPALLAVKILVQTLAGKRCKSIKFHVKEAESIESLQDEQKTRGMLPDRQCLISVGKQLENTLWDNTCNSS